MTRVWLEGRLASGVTAKDAALALVAKIGSNGAAGHSVEFAGPGTGSLSLDARMTLSNMAVEMGAVASIIATDDLTIANLEDRFFAPVGADRDLALEFWRGLPTDESAAFDGEERLDLSSLAPMVTWGNGAEPAVPITQSVPDPSGAQSTDKRAAMERSLDYMGLSASLVLDELAIDQVFIGAWTNARIEELREAAEAMRGRSVSIPTLVVPGSGLVKLQAEKAGSLTYSWVQAPDEERPDVRCASP